MSGQVNQPKVAPVATTVPGGGNTGMPQGSAPKGAPTAPAQPKVAPVAAQPFFVARSIDEMVDYQNILIYGDYGSGKTTLAASAVLVPEMCDVLFISVEGGEKALKEVARMARAKGVDPNRILVIPIQTFSQFANIYEAVKLHVRFRDTNDLDNLRKLEAQLKFLPAHIRNDATLLREVIPDPLKIQTVIIDSISEAHKYCMYQLLGVDVETQRIDGKPSSAEWGDWGGAREMIQFLVRRFRDLPVHAIFTAAEEVKEDKMKVFHHNPMLSGKLSNDVRGLVDTVGFLMDMTNADGTITRRCILRSLVFNGSQSVQAKHRYGSKLQEAWIDNPTMQHFHDLNQ